MGCTDKYCRCVFCVFSCEKQFSVNLRPPYYYEPLVCHLLSFLPTFSICIIDWTLFFYILLRSPHAHFYFVLLWLSSLFFSPPFLTFQPAFIGCIWCPVIFPDLVTAINCFFSVSLNIIDKTTEKKQQNTFLQLFYIEVKINWTVPATACVHIAIIIMLTLMLMLTLTCIQKKGSVETRNCTRFKNKCKWLYSCRCR